MNVTVCPGVERFSTDQWFLYAGGTIGMLKGVMWSHDSLWNVLGDGDKARAHVPSCADMDELLDRFKNTPFVTVNISLPPIMHGTGMMANINAMVAGGTCITLPSKNF